MYRLLVSIPILVLMGLPLRAASPQDVARLVDLLGLPQIIEIMREEGIDNGATMAQDMFAGQGGTNWTSIVATIYDKDWMARTIVEGLNRGLAQTDATPLIAYFDSDAGKQVTTLEISARRALMDKSIEAASKEQLALLVESEDPRLDLITRYMDANDLLEFNVVGTLNSNFAFYSGLATSGAFEESLNEDQILRDVWSQEAEIRADTEEWLLSFFVLAYQPLSDADLDGLIALSGTREGQDLNLALFMAFDEMFEQISTSLGLAVAQFMDSQEL